MGSDGVGVVRPSAAVVDGLAALGIRRLVFAIHDASLPGGGDADIGRGVPASAAALRLFAFVRETGFDGVQVGPQGLTDEHDASPYMGALFSRSPLSISLSRLTDPQGEYGELVPSDRLARIVATRPAGADARVPYAFAYRTQRAALGLAFERFERGHAAGDADARRVADRLAVFRAEAGAWLESDALYEALRGEYRGRDWPFWNGPQAALDRSLGGAGDGDPARSARRDGLVRRYEPALRFYRFVQLVAHEQHARFREALHRLDLRLYGDLQVGVSPRDTWRHAGLFLDDWRMGAPPSRTNPEGQPWDYPVLDPERYRDDADPSGEGPALRFVAERMAKMFAEYDAVRIDHPQGLVCPWVYRADDPDPLRAVQRGARLFSSPRVAEHPALARYAIAEPDQLAPGDATPRFADDWVAALRPEQVDRYAVLFDRVVEEAGGAAEAGAKLVCEVLSTLPHPLARVLERHGLGRFRVTQKADPTDPRDVYRAENAAPQDWIMFGNHDTPPLWRLLGAWRADGRLGLRADLAAARLAPAGADREAFRAALTDRPELLGQAEIAQLFASPAENVSVFFADFFGLEEVYNRPGTLDADNWTLRLPPDWREAYATRLRDDRALNLPLALYWALRARPGAGSPELLVALRREAEAVRAAPALP